MRVAYDPSSKRVIVAFRGQITVLPGSYETETLGRTAGENHCQSRGWRPRELAHAGGSLLRSLY